MTRGLAGFVASTVGTLVLDRPGVRALWSSCLLMGAAVGGTDRDRQSPRKANGDRERRTASHHERLTSSSRPSRSITAAAAFINASQEDGVTPIRCSPPQTP